MALERKEKPDWFDLLDRVKAIREMEMGTGRDLAKHLGVAEQRITEWLCASREAKAQKTLEIQEWVSAKEGQISSQSKATEYSKILKRIKTANG